MKGINYKGVKIIALKGDITNLEAECIVNPANSLMIMGGGVAGAIKRKGGSEIEEEAMRHAPVPVGQSIVTMAGGLKCRYIIHSPTMEKPGGETSLENVYSAASSALKKAEEVKCKKLVFPVLGSGVGGLPVLESSKKIAEAIKENLSDKSSIREIIICGLTHPTLIKICEALKTVFHE